MMNKQQLFDICKDNNSTYIFATSFVEIIKGKDNKLFINKVDWTLLSLGFYDESDLDDEIMNLIPSDHDITTDGWYNIDALFSIHTDDNGVGHTWTYLEPEIVEMDFAISIEDMEQQNNETTTDLTQYDQLFCVNVKQNFQPKNK